ncbi:winged helix-turn-helix transcriptional regulator [Brevibacillus porteri]|uniref:winged helix-turn-helix transcriptional regulator n=1 Tax=Brevibacillus porteri TaxID=2126350 RepID=UPI003D20729B
MMYLLNGKEYPCPIELAVSVFAGRWKVSIICQLLGGKKRYGELKKNIIGVNHKMLAEQLRELEEAGIVKREVYPVVPPKVEYELTELGQGLGPVIDYLREWGAHFQTDTTGEPLSSAHGS